MIPKDIYIDLGTENTRIYAKNKGMLLNQPTIIAQSSRINTLAIGDLAKKMLGRAPNHLLIHKPLQRGVIQEFEQAKEMLSKFLKDSKNEMLLSRSRILISLPHEVFEEEREIFRAVAYDLGAGIVDLVSEPLAGAIGAGADIFSDSPIMSIDLGAGTSEVIVTLNGQIVKSEAVRVGGDDISSEIISLLCSRDQFSIGEQTAEKIKKMVAFLKPDPSEIKSCSASGINLTTGFPETRMIDSKIIQPAVLPTFEKIAQLINRCFEEFPIEMIKKVKRKGIHLFGGNSLISGSAQFLFENSDVLLHRAVNPLMSVTIGGSRILEDDSLFKSLKL